MQPEVPPAAVSSGMPQPGDQIADEYLVERTMGEGGMGVVLAARRRSDGVKVAVKMLRPEAAVQPESLTRFVREAQASAAIRSEHVARVYDVGTTIIGVPYIVMEFLDGQDFGQILTERSWLPTAEAVDYMLQACEAVAHAHRLGIVHRDLKPANLFLTRKPDGSPLVKVIDFGISKITVPGADTALTATSFAFGTPMYMSPEQVRSTKHVDPRTDLWALGAILHEMLTGLPPFEGDSLPALSAAIIADPPRSLRQARPDVPEALERAIHSCLQKPVHARPATVLDFARAIAPFGSPGTARAMVAAIARVGAPTVPLMRSSPELNGSGSHPAWSATSSPSSSSRRWVVLGGLGFVAAGVAAVIAVKQLHLTGDSPAASAPAASAAPPASALASAPASASASASTAPVRPTRPTRPASKGTAAPARTTAQPTSPAPKLIENERH